MLMATLTQGQTLLYMVFGGILIGLFYDVMRSIRHAAPACRWWNALWDALFWLVTGVFLAVLLYLGNEGEIRVFVILGLVIGVSLYMLGPSYPIRRCMDGLIAFLLRIAKRLGQTRLFRFILK